MKSPRSIRFVAGSLKAHPFTRIVMVLLLLGPAACSPADRSGQDADAPRLTYGTSLRVFALILEEITGDSAQIEVLISDTQSPHAFHPRPSDMDRLGRSRMLFLGDPALDGWAERMGSQDVVYLANLISSQPRLSLDLSTNPHFWTDPVLVRALIPGLTDVLCEKDPPGCQSYRDNASRFADALAALSVEFQTRLKPLTGACVFTSQPFFDYFLARYGITSAGTIEIVPGNETSAAHLARLLDRAEAQPCAGVLAQRRLPDTAARLFSTETGLRLVYIDPIGTQSDSSYADLFRRNADAIHSLITEAP